MFTISADRRHPLRVWFPSLPPDVAKIEYVSDNECHLVKLESEGVRTIGLQFLVHCQEKKRGELICDNQYQQLKDITFG